MHALICAFFGALQYFYLLAKKLILELTWNGWQLSNYKVDIFAHISFFVAWWRILLRLVRSEHLSGCLLQLISFLSLLRRASVLNSLHNSFKVLNYFLVPPYIWRFALILKVTVNWLTYFFYAISEMEAQRSGLRKFLSFQEWRKLVSAFLAKGPQGLIIAVIGNRFTFSLRPNMTHWVKRVKPAHWLPKTR